MYVNHAKMGSWLGKASHNSCQQNCGWLHINWLRKTTDHKISISNLCQGDLVQVEDRKGV